MKRKLTKTIAGHTVQMREDERLKVKNYFEWRRWYHIRDDLDALYTEYPEILTHFMLLGIQESPTTTLGGMAI